MRKVLHLMDFFADVDIEWMATRGTKSLISAGTLLIQEGKEIDSMYVILDGELSVYVGGATENEIARLLAGEVVGEMSFVDERPPSASVVAKRDSRVLCISRQILAEKLAKDPPFSARFYRGIAIFLSERMRKTVAQLGYGSVQPQTDADGLDDTAVRNISVAAARFDDLLKRLRAA
jgi:CRP/FNR family transcriptional regulator, cyclic AMP receptor protein